LKRIVMIGSDRDVRGGVSAVVRVCEEQGLFERWNAIYLAPHRDGTPSQKAAQALRAWATFMGMVRRHEAALLHVHLNSDASFWRKALFIVPAIAAGIPYVLQVHCGRFPEFYRDGCGALSRRFVRWVLSRARSVLALSDGSREALSSIDPQLPVAVLPNPVAIPPWKADTASEPPTVLYLGMLTEAKGVFDLLRAWKAVKMAIPAARLVLAGVGEVERVHALARAAGFGADLVTPGWVDDAGKAALMRRAALVVLPSHWEAMPMSVLESMAAGLPVVASRVGGIPSVVLDGVTGLLVQPRDINGLAEALVALLRDPVMRRAMGDAGRERASAEFSAGVVVPRLEAVWRALVPHNEVAAPPRSGSGTGNCLDRRNAEAGLPGPVN
jgi:glycosyltransferase involved in cell wall biosynthesis